MKHKIHYRLEGGEVFEADVDPDSVQVPISGALIFKDLAGDYIGYAPRVWESFWVEKVGDDGFDTEGP